MTPSRQPGDAAARERAVDPGHSYIVQAPAGSGKTSLLTDRIIALLAIVQRPEQIVAMTFTRKAAAEMHHRVMEKLHQASSDQAMDASGDPRSLALARAALERDQKMGWNLLEQPARLRIQTIDAFCASLVKAMPWFSGLGGMPAISANPQRLYEQAASGVIELAGEFEAVDALLRHLDLDVANASHAIAEMLGRRDQWLPVLGQVRDTRAEAVLERALQQAIESDLAALRQTMPSGWEHALAPSARMAAASLLEKGEDNFISALQAWEPGEIGGDSEHLALWQGLAQLLLTEKGTVRRSLNKNQGCDPKTEQKESLTQWLSAWRDDESLLWADHLHFVRDMPSPQLAPEQAQILRAQIEVLLLAAAQLQLEFTRAAEVDFIEVAQRAAMALGRADDPTDLLLRLDQQISHLLIDEFQDTSQAQLELLGQLVSGWEPDDGRTLFVVGDPMQSIYRFRKAEVGLFLQAKQVGVATVALEPLVLQENFRSNGSLVQWVNDVFSKILPQEDSVEMGAIRHSPASAWHAETDESAVQWHLLADDASVQARVVELARQSWERYGACDKPVAILVRNRSHLGQVTLALRQSGLPTRAVDLEGLGERPVVMQLVALARAMAHPADRAAWLEALRAPWCGLTLSSLHTLLWQFPQICVADVLVRWLEDEVWQQSFEKDQCARLLSVAPRLLEALDDDGELPFSARIEALWRTLDGPALVQEATDLEDAQALFALMDDLATHSHLDMDVLQDQLKGLFATPAAGTQNAIEVMTMHKSKGLEYESVILMGLDRPARSDRAPLVRIEQTGSRVLFGPVKPSIQSHQDPISHYLGAREAKRQAYESDRLLYVAVTRARQSLHLVAKVGIDAKKGGIKPPSTSSMLARLWSFCPPEQLRDILEQAALASATQPEQEGAAPQWVGPPLWRRAQPSTLPDTPSHSKLTQTESAWRVQPGSERLVGELVHAWFAHYAITGSRHMPALSQVERQLAQQGLAAGLREQAAQQVREGLQAMLDSERGQWLLAQKQAHIEWSLMDDQARVSILDLAIDRTNHWLVVDYKLSRKKEGEPLDAFEARMIAQYREQLERYAQQLHALDGRAVVAALFLPFEDLWIEMPGQAS